MTTPSYPIYAPQQAPMTFGSTFSAAFNTLKKRFGLFVALAVLPSLVALACILISTFGFIGIAMGDLNADRTPVAGIVFSIVFGLVSIVAMYFAQVKADAMGILLTRETAFGRRPTFDDLNKGTKGVVQRAVVVLFIMLGAGLAVSLVFGVIVGIVAAAGSGKNTSSGLMVVMFLLYVALIVASIWVSIKLIYYMQAITLENASGSASLKRSWSLTNGSWWRTFGWMFLLGLIAGIVPFIVEMAFAGTLAAAASTMSSSSDSSAAFAAIAPTMALFYLVMIAFGILIAPFMLIFKTVMFNDQLYRKAVADGVATAYPAPYGMPVYPGTPAGMDPNAVGQSPYGQQGFPPPMSAPVDGPSAPGMNPYGQPQDTTPYAQPAPGSNPYERPREDADSVSQQAETPLPPYNPNPESPDEDTDK